VRGEGILSLLHGVQIGAELLLDMGREGEVCPFVNGG